VREGFADPAAFAEWLYDQLPVQSPWDRVIGPCYTTEQLTKRFKVSRQALFDRVRRHTLLGLRTSDGQIVYPVFQFHGDKVISGLSRVLRITAGAVDDWTLASWLVAQQPELGMSVVDAVRKFGAAEEVLRVAELAKESWSR